jgi:hypothetical protein
MWGAFVRDVDDTVPLVGSPAGLHISRVCNRDGPSRGETACSAAPVEMEEGKGSVLAGESRIRESLEWKQEAVGRIRPALGGFVGDCG